jgi:GT2 family glycosyltransferase
LDNVADNCSFITFLDADDISYPGRIRRQQSMLTNDASIDVIYGRMLMFRSWDDAIMAPAAGSPTQIVRGPYLQSSIYRPAVIDKVGRFDETYSQGDDTDFFLRVIDHGFRVVLDEEIAAYYRRHNSNVTLNVEQRQQEFMKASLKWAVRRRRSGKASFPPIYSEMFLKVGEVEKDFDK